VGVGLLPLSKLRPRQIPPRQNLIATQFPTTKLYYTLYWQSASAVVYEALAWISEVSEDNSVLVLQNMHQKHSLGAVIMRL